MKRLRADFLLQKLAAFARCVYAEDGKQREE